MSDESTEAGVIEDICRHVVGLNTAWGWDELPEPLRDDLREWFRKFLAFAKEEMK